MIKQIEVRRSKMMKGPHRMQTADMTEEKYIKEVFMIVLIVLLVSFCLNGIESATALTVNESGTSSPIIVDFAFPAPELTKVGDYDSITMVGLYSHGDPGMPILPFKTVKSLIPQDDKVFKYAWTRLLQVMEMGKLRLIVEMSISYPNTHDSRSYVYCHP
ncbi:hypothetical protein C5S53_15850 [Methanophagales archaeon]|nr:hypothetical protein C5S53_15850 [Methanophagales archaeon]